MVLLRPRDPVDNSSPGRAGPFDWSGILWKCGPYDKGGRGPECATWASADLKWLRSVAGGVAVGSAAAAILVEETARLINSVSRTIRPSGRYIRLDKEVIETLLVY
jgi:hypothetical protein